MLKTTEKINPLELIKELQSNKKNKNIIKQEYEKFTADFINRHDKDNYLFLTLATNNNYTIDHLEKSLNNWTNNIKVRMFRKNVTNDKFNYIAFPEYNTKQRPHYHLIVYLDKDYHDYFNKLYSKFWKKQVPHGSVDLKPITEAQGLISYVTKDMYKKELQDYIYCR